MGHWNHRVTRQKTRFGDWYAIREVYYDDQGNVTAWTEGEMAPVGETVEELRADLERMLAALDEPVLYVGEAE